jgi:signal transduction histidine kinase/DNA-binding response OmpR family regulator/ligand-binding sensor domain-containing protein
MGSVRQLPIARLRLAALLLMTVLNNILWGQDTNMRIERISVDRGLDVHRVISILQDQKGFIWLGTKNGIYRYDGYNFRSYKTPPRCLNGDSYRFGTVTKIIEDTSGLIWAVSAGGLFIIDPVTESSVRFPGIGEPGQELFRYYDWEPDMLYDSAGAVWITGERGLIRISPSEHFRSSATRKEKLRHPDEAFKLEMFHRDAMNIPLGNPVHTICQDHLGSIWACYNGGLYVRMKNREGFHEVEAVNPWLANGIKIREMESLDQRGIAVATSEGILLLKYSSEGLSRMILTGDTSELEVKHILSQLGIMSMELYRNQELLVGTEFDLLRMDLETGNVANAPGSMYKGWADPDQSGYLIGVGDLMVDPAGVLWAGHVYYGLHKILLNSTAFKGYESLVREHLGNTDVNPVHMDETGDLWVGTFGDGLYRINKRSGQVDHYKPEKGLLDVECLIESVPGTFWVGLRGGVLKFDRASGIFSDPLPSGEIKKELRNTYVLTIAAKDQMVFLGTPIGLIALDTESGLIRRISMKNDATTEGEYGFRSLLVTRDGEVWADCDSGICRIDYTGLNDITVVPIYRRNVKEENFNLYSYVLYEDHEGYIWHTSQSKVSRIDRKTGDVKSFRLSHPAYPETRLLARSIQEDEHSSLWIGTQFGLCQFNKESGEIRLFDQNDGLPILIHGHLSSSKDMEGNLIFGGIGGFYQFHPDSIHLNTNEPRVVITDFRLFNKSVPVDTAADAILTRSISYTDHIELRYDQNDLAFEFSALDYSDPSKNRYAYTLENFQDEWIAADATNRLAIYTNLDPGKYTFRVKGSNNHQTWNESDTSLSIIIRPPWYRTILAYSLYGLILVVSVLGFIYLRTRKLLNEKRKLETVVASRTHELELANRQLEQQKTEIQSQRDCLEESHKRISELDRLKTRFFTNISHEFRTMLTLIQTPVRNLLADNGISTKIRQSFDMVDRNVSRLANLVNQLLDISRIDRGRVRLMLSGGNVQYFVRSVATAFKATSEVRGIEYYLRIRSDSRVTLFDADKLEKILNNLLSNAFKFTDEGGRVSVESIHQVGPEDSDRLTVSVTNTGIGIPEEEQEKIFDRFYQAESNLKKEGGGTGIGLALVYELVHLLHGNITVKSEVDKETTFSIEIPLGNGHLTEDEYTIVEDQKRYPAKMKGIETNIIPEVPLPSASPQTVSTTSKDRATILIVEDNEDLRWLVAERFRSEFTVLQAVDGKAGLKVAIDRAPDLVITDLMMPRMEGTELCKQLKGTLETSHIPVLMLTAKATQQQKLEGLESGADDYITKPFDIRELELRAKNLVEQRQLLRERFGNRITLDPGEITITPMDQRFLQQAMDIVETHMGDEYFDVKEFREEMNMSRSTLTRKLQALTNQAPVEFIRTMRLKRGADLLRMGFGNVSEVAMEVGFSNPSYFSKMFKNIYHLSPAEYLRTCKTQKTHTEPAD